MSTFTSIGDSAFAVIKGSSFRVFTLPLRPGTASIYAMMLPGVASGASRGITPYSENRSR